ncbi:MAG TPA: hypothetical protein VGL64_15020 [Amycolatopsis sp.]
MTSNCAARPSTVTERTCGTAESRPKDESACVETARMVTEAFIVVTPGR